MDIDNGNLYFKRSDDTADWSTPIPFGKGEKGDSGDPASDNQELLFDGGNLTITGGNTVTIPDEVDDADADPRNRNTGFTT